jgi:hypothetical protein
MEKVNNFVKEDNKNMGLKSSQVQQNKSVIKIENFYLLKTAQSLIDHVLRELYHKYHIEVKTRNDRTASKKPTTIDISKERKLLKFKN